MHMRYEKTSKYSTRKLTGQDISSIGTQTNLQSMISTKRPLMEESMANLSHVAGDWIMHWKILHRKVVVSQGSIWKQMRNQRTKGVITQRKILTTYMPKERERIIRVEHFLVYVFYFEKANCDIQPWDNMSHQGRRRSNHETRRNPVEGNSL